MLDLWATDKASPAGSTGASVDDRGRFRGEGMAAFAVRLTCQTGHEAVAAQDVDAMEHSV